MSQKEYKPLYTSSEEHKPLYAQRDASQLDEDGNYYSRHIYAMTREGLSSKSSIAAELGHRDAQIEKLAKGLKWALGELGREPFEWSCEEQHDAHQQALDALGRSNEAQP